jgi:hypothetical protein
MALVIRDAATQWRLLAPLVAAFFLGTKRRNRSNLELPNYHAASKDTELALGHYDVFERLELLAPEVPLC